MKSMTSSGFLYAEDVCRMILTERFVVYLKQRGRRWFLLHTIPPKVTILDAKGKRKVRFSIALKTEDRRVAVRRMGPIMAGWLTECKFARNSDPLRGSFRVQS